MIHQRTQNHRHLPRYSAPSWGNTPIGGENIDSEWSDTDDSDDGHDSILGNSSRQKHTRSFHRRRSQSRVRARPSTHRGEPLSAYRDNAPTSPGSYHHLEREDGRHSHLYSRPHPYHAPHAVSDLEGLPSVFRSAPLRSENLMPTNHYAGHGLYAYPMTGYPHAAPPHAPPLEPVRGSDASIPASINNAVEEIKKQISAFKKEQLVSQERGERKEKNMERKREKERKKEAAERKRENRKMLSKLQSLKEETEHQIQFQLKRNLQRTKPPVPRQVPHETARPALSGQMKHLLDYILMQTKEQPRPLQESNKGDDTELVLDALIEHIGQLRNQVGSQRSLPEGQIPGFEATLDGRLQAKRPESLDARELARFREEDPQTRTQIEEAVLSVIGQIMNRGDEYQRLLSGLQPASIVSDMYYDRDRRRRREHNPHYSNSRELPPQGTRSFSSSQTAVNPDQFDPSAPSDSELSSAPQLRPRRDNPRKSKAKFRRSHPLPKSRARRNRKESSSSSEDTSDVAMDESSESEETDSQYQTPSDSPYSSAWEKPREHLEKGHAEGKKNGRKAGRNSGRKSATKSRRTRRRKHAKSYDNEESDSEIDSSNESGDEDTFFKSSSTRYAKKDVPPEVPQPPLPKPKARTTRS